MRTTWTFEISRSRLSDHHTAAANLDKIPIKLRLCHRHQSKMCIFFLPSLCPFGHQRIEDLQAGGEMARACWHLSNLMKGPEVCRIGRCLTPTHKIPYFCDNPLLGIEVRHASSSENPAGELDACRRCSAIARIWQTSLLEATRELRNDPEMAQEWEMVQQGWKLVARHMVRDENQMVVKQRCRCEFITKVCKPADCGEHICGAVVRNEASLGSGAEEPQGGGET